MTVKREAAFHEAGHAVVAHFSKFHAIVGRVNLGEYGAGTIHISLSKRKLSESGKNEGLASQKDKDVTADLAIVLSAGLVAERIAEEMEPGLSANPTCAEPDYQLMKQQLEGAGLSRKFDRHEKAAKKLLQDNWDLVRKLADHLFEKQSVEAVDLHDFIEARIAPPVAAK